MYRTTSANERLFELMRSEAEKYAQECVKKCNIEHIKTMILQGYDNNSIKLIVNVTDGEIDELRGAVQ